MMNVCLHCGEYRADKRIDPDGPNAVCPLCGHRHPFRQLPLLVVSGASGAGKSAVLQRLAGRVDGAVLLDADILWRSEFDQPEEGYRGFFETWLRLCKNISQSGRPVVLFGAGVGVPANLEACVERRYLADVHILALVCDDEVLAERLLSRPEWRRSGDAGFGRADPLQPVVPRPWKRHRASDRGAGHHGNSDRGDRRACCRVDREQGREVRMDEQPFHSLLSHALQPAPGVGRWYGGATLLGALRGVGAELAAWTPAGLRNSIWRLALHCAYWEWYVARKFEESRSRERFPRQGYSWPELPDVIDDKTWSADRALARSGRMGPSPSWGEGY